MPERLHGVDREATWGKSRAKGWIYGHGTFMLTSYRLPIVGIFQWMPNSGNEAKRMENEIWAVASSFWLTNQYTRPKAMAAKPTRIAPSP